MPKSRSETTRKRPGRSERRYHLLHPLWSAVVGVLAAFPVNDIRAGGVDQLYPADPFSVYNLAHDTRANYLSMPCENGTPNRPLALSDIVDRALCHNTQTREAWMTTRMRAAELGVSKGAYLPAITVEASLNRVLSENSQINIGQTVPQRYNQHSLGVNVSYVLLDFGTRSAQVESAKEILTSANATLNETIQSVYLAAAKAYYDLFSAQASLASTQQAENYALEAVTAAKGRHASGVAALNDVLQAQMQYSQARLNRQEAEARVKTQQGLVAMTIGLPIETAFELNAPDVSYKTEEPEEKQSKAEPSERKERVDIVADTATDIATDREGRYALRPSEEINKQLDLIAAMPDSSALDTETASSSSVLVSSPALAFVQDLEMGTPNKFYLAPNQAIRYTAFIPGSAAAAEHNYAADFSKNPAQNPAHSALQNTYNMHKRSISANEGVPRVSFPTFSAEGSPQAAGVEAIDARKIKPAAIAEDVTALMNKAEAGRPVLQAAQAQVRSAEARLRAVNAQGFPTLVLTMGASDLKRTVTQPITNGLTGQRSSITSKLGGTEKTIGVSVQFPLFDGFNRQYQRQAAESQLELARLEAERLNHQVKLEVWRAYQDTLLQLQSIQSTQDLLTSAQHNYKMAEGRYGAGVGSMLEWMSAQVGLRSAEQQHIHALHNWQIARLKLAQSIGRLGLDKI